MIVMDLNDFKHINDTYGHHVGDTALRAASTALRTAIRPYDICVRYAGDEFVVVLTDCGRGQADSKRVELEDAAGRIVLEPRPGDRLSLSISAGAAVPPPTASRTTRFLMRPTVGCTATNVRIKPPPRPSRHSYSPFSPSRVSASRRFGRADPDAGASTPVFT